MIAELLEAEGFEVTVFESAMDRLMRLPPEERAKSIMGMYAGKAAIAEFASKQDLIINVANVQGLMQPTERVAWPASKGTPDIPWYVHEVPTIFVSVGAPFVLADAPQVPCFINTYDSKDTTLKVLIEKLTGRSEFKGVNPVDAFCGLVDTRI